MGTTRFLWLFVTIVLGPSVVLPCSASAQDDYPSRQVRVVVPFLAGGAVDVVTRIVFNRLSERWNQTVIVENKAGAGGNIGADVVAKSEPDGYTLLSTPPSVLAINQYLYEKLPFNPEEAFSPVCLLGLLPNVLVVGPSVKAETLTEWVEEARRQPGRFSYASQGLGTTGHLTGEMLNGEAGLALRHIPYRGFPPALTDVITGQVDAMFMDTGNALPRVGKDGLRALAVATQGRVRSLPDVPTFEESGLPAVLSSTWFSVVAPGKTSPRIREKISHEIHEVLRSSEVRTRLEALGVEFVASSPKHLESWITSEKRLWSAVIRRSKIKAN